MTCLSRPARLALFASTLAAGIASAQRPIPRPDPLAGFDSYVTEAMKAWRVPGLAIAAVRGDSIVLAKGYGVRTLGDPTPVDASTLFAIGSATKAFTGAALGMLADEGKISFDGRVIDFLPWFALQDPWLTRELRISDLLLHRSGLSRGDQLFYGTTLSREEIVRAIRLLKPTAPFRTTFQYNNLMYITAGEVIRAVTGRSYDEVIAERILGPLGMSQSNLSVNDLVGQPNVATPHAEIDGTLRPVAYRNIDAAAASGSINSNVMDMTRWLRLWLGRGMFEGKRLLTERAVDEAIRGHFAIDDPFFVARLDSPTFLSYGYGWFVQDFHGRRRISHGGNIDGMAALVGFLPDDGIGVVILTNMNQSDITIPLMSHLFDRLLGIQPVRDYSAAYKAKADAFEARQRASTPAPARILDTKPTLPLADYGGSYQHPYLGTATVRVEPTSGLSIQYERAPTVGGPLVHWHYDTFTVKLRDPVFGSARVTFRVGASGKVTAMQFTHGGLEDWVRIDPPTP